MSTEASKELTQEATASPRVISIVTTRGERTKIPFEGNSWKELKKLLQRGGDAIDATGKAVKFSAYDLNNMKCVESIGKHTLEHDEAAIPEGDFALFLMPYKSKSGAGMSRSDINAIIKVFIEKDGQAAKDFFAIDGKNYTKLASSKLEELIEQYKPGKAKKVSDSKSKAIGQVVDSVKKSKNNKTEETEQKEQAADAELYDEVSRMSVNEQMFLIIKLLTNINSKLGEGKASAEVTEEQPDLTKQVKEETPEEKQAREEKEEKDRLEKESIEKDRKEKEELEKEMSSLMGGFSDVKR